MNKASEASLVRLPAQGRTASQLSRYGSTAPYTIEGKGELLVSEKSRKGATQGRPTTAKKKSWERTETAAGPEKKKTQ